MSPEPFSSLVMRFNFQVAIAAFVIGVAATGATAQTSRPYIYHPKDRLRSNKPEINTSVISGP